MGDQTRIRDAIDTGVRRAIEAVEMQPRTRRRVGIAAGGTATLAALVSGAANLYQMHLADAKNVRVMAAAEHEAEACQERVEKAYQLRAIDRAEYARHMREAHGL